MNWVNAKSTDMVRIEMLGEGAVSQTGRSWVECSERAVKLAEEVDRLRIVIARLPRKEDIELALAANGGLDFREDYCHCDPSVGQSPCQYCAIDSVLRRVLRAVEAGGSEP